MKPFIGIIQKTFRVTPVVSDIELVNQLSQILGV